MTDQLYTRKVVIDSGRWMFTQPTRDSVVDIERLVTKQCGLVNIIRVNSVDVFTDHGGYKRQMVFEVVGHLKPRKFSRSVLRDIRMKRIMESHP
jgi:hypothetical protein